MNTPYCIVKKVPHFYCAKYSKCIGTFVKFFTFLIVAIDQLGQKYSIT